MGPVKARGSFRMVVNRLYYGQHDQPTPLNTATHAIGISAETLAEVLQSIYQREFNPKADIEPNLFRAIAGQLTEAVNEGAAPTLGSDPMLHALRHSADVFSAFKTHRTQNDMAALLLDENGNLKPFERWQNDVQPIASHQCRSWLETEYNTAVLRARQAADWQQFEAEKDVLPNLKWLPSTSPNPGADHMPFWNTILPIDHPFWNQHRPGDRWNCKCELTSTAEPPTAAPDVPDGKGSDPQRGLKGNPGKTQAVFSQDHPYFPSGCHHCPFYKPSPIARLRHLFQNREKDCYNCPYIEGCIERTVAKEPIDDAAKAIKANIRKNDLMPLTGDIEISSLVTGMLHLSGKSRKRFLKHAHHDYDVKAAIYAWNNPEELHSPRVSPLGEGKNLADPEVRANIQRKKDRHVDDYIEYKFKYDGRRFLVKLERMTFGKEQFYSIMEE